jgi:cation diffusion facilitator family transporter
MDFNRDNYQFQRKIALFTIFLFVLKLVAWAITHSVAILTDALEYTINVVASIIGLYSLRLSAIPKDSNHPYGHGKAEFVSAAVEGMLMIVSSAVIVYGGVDNLWHPHPLHQLDYGIGLIALTAAANYVIGMLAIKKGKSNTSLQLTATGMHLQSDTLGTLGILVGLVVIYFTGLIWVDSVVSFVFAIIIFRSGYKILRGSLAGIMDEADEKLLSNVVQYLNTNRRANWMDIHNLRIIKYGSILHLDCHLTIPWYFNILEGHAEVDALEQMVRVNFGEQVELFVHTDGCLPFSCAICSKLECNKRQNAHQKTIEWKVENVSSNRKHDVAVT